MYPPNYLPIVYWMVAVALKKCKLIHLSLSGQNIYMEAIIIAVALMLNFHQRLHFSLNSCNSFFNKNCEK